METLATDLIFMVFGLGFFLYVIHMARQHEREDHARRIMELREFGFQDMDLPKRRRSFSRKEK